jgi:hypothetical protein
MHNGRILSQASKVFEVYLRFTNLLLSELSQTSKTHPHRKTKIWRNHDCHGLSWFGLFW